MKQKHLDAALISETFLKSHIRLQTHPDFKTYRLDRADRPKGGVAIIIRRSIEHKLLPSGHTTLIEAIGIQITLNHSNKVTIFSVYLPGGTNNKNINQYLANDINKLTSTGGKYFICGDLNAKHRNWGCLRANRAGTILNNLKYSGDFEILYPNEPTYIPSDPKNQESTLDIMITNTPLGVTDLKCYGDLQSDHKAVSFEIVTTNIKLKKEKSTFLDYKNADYEKYRFIVQYVIGKRNFDTLCKSSEELEYYVNKFIEIINYARNKSVPIKPVRGQSEVDLTPEIQNLINDKKSLNRKWLRDRDPEVKKSINRLEKQIKWRVKELKNERWGNLLNDIKPSSQVMWKLSRFCKKGPKTLPPLIKDGRIHITAKEKADLVREAFNKNHQNPLDGDDPVHTQKINQEVERNLKDSTAVIDSELADVDEIKHVIRNLKNSKAPGLDGINNSLLKQLPQRGIEFLKFIVNSCLSLSYFPNCWKHAKVIALHKPGKPTNNPNSYRPISLLSSISKILERIILKRITQHTEANEIIPEQQCGFRAKRSTTFQINNVLNNARDNLNQQKSTGMIFLDVEKAFDRVWHKGLLYKMIKLNFPIGITKMVESFLHERTFAVCIEGQFSDRANISYGLPQGAVLSPTLYNIYTYDIIEETTPEMTLFADDTAIYHSATKADDVIEALKSKGKKVQAYMRKWKISINKEKTQGLYITRRRKKELPGESINIFNEDIKWSSNIKYLGMVIDKKISLKKHIDYVAQRADTALRLLYPLISRTSKLCTYNRLLLYKLAIRPIFTYGCPAFEGIAKSQISKLQIIQNKFLRIILNKSRYEKITDMHSEAKIPLVGEYIKKLQGNFKQRLET